MENNDLLISGNYNHAGFDNTKWYTINYTAIKKMMEPWITIQRIPQRLPV